MVFLPYVMLLSSGMQFAGREAVLAMDDYLGHITQVIVRLLGESHVRVVRLALHAVRIFHALIAPYLKSSRNGAGQTSLRQCHRSIRISPENLPQLPGNDDFSERSRCIPCYRT
jgi:hypothetical protein